MAQSVEAVILSGPRRGEIVRLTEDALPELSDADLAMLNAGLDDIIAAISRLSAEYRQGTEALRKEPAD
jgi:hypothetical protein